LTKVRQSALWIDGSLFNASEVIFERNGNRSNLVSLQQRTKWRQEKPNLKEGQLVLIKHENTHHAKWPMGRIISTTRGQDDNVRVVTVKTNDGEVKRSLNKICQLPVSEAKPAGAATPSITESMQLRNDKKFRQRVPKDKRNGTGSIATVLCCVSILQATTATENSEPRKQAEELGNI